MGMLINRHRIARAQEAEAERLERERRATTDFLANFDAEARASAEPRPEDVSAKDSQLGESGERPPVLEGSTENDTNSAAATPPTEEQSSGDPAAPSEVAPSGDDKPSERDSEPAPSPQESSEQRRRFAQELTDAEARARSRRR